MRYIIPRGKEFYCEFVIKEPGASIPMDVAGMTGEFTLSKIGVHPCRVLTVPISVVDDSTGTPTPPGHIPPPGGTPPGTIPPPSQPAGKNGLISISLTAAQTDVLIGCKGFAEDGYSLISTYSGSLSLMKDYPIDIVIPKIYILDDGTSCVNP